MFEFDQEIVDTLIESDDRFARLHTKHQQLNARVDDANAGLRPDDDTALERMKKERLMIRDQMAQMIAAYRRSQSAHA